MTYIGPVGTPPGVELAYRRPRPATVTAAAIGLFAVALLGLISAVLSFVEAGPVGERVAAESGDANMATNIIVVFGVIALVATVYFVLAGIFVIRGNRGMRITTWVVAGLTVLCLGCNGLNNGLLASGLVHTTATAGTQQGIMVADSESQWYVTSTALLEFAATLAVIAAIILLASPASNTYFRKFDPVAAMYAYPGYAYAYPYAVPGQPAQGQATPGYPASYQVPEFPPVAHPQWQSVPPPQVPAQQPIEPPRAAEPQPSDLRPAETQPISAIPGEPSDSVD